MPPRLKPLSQQTLVITGASSGIGLVTARRAAKAGARVFLISRNAEVLGRIADEITAGGGDADFAVADVADQAQVSAAAAAAARRFGGFDAWLNIAGVGLYAPLLQTPREEHERLFRTNYWGVVNGCSAAVPHLREGGGALITVGSVVSDIGTPVLGAYAASKHAAKGYIDSLRIELLAQKAPISVTLIKPSGIGSPLAEHAANHMPHAAKVPPPAYTPDAVAEAILFACQRPRREMIVGGLGALQLLGAATAPALLDRISTWVIPLLTDRRRPPNPIGNLFGQGEDGEERSPHERMLPGNLYSQAARHRTLLAVGLISLMATIAYRRQDRSRSKGVRLSRRPI